MPANPRASRRARTGVLALTVVALCAAAGVRARPAAPEPPLEEYRLVLLHRGPAWTSRRTPHSDSVQAGHIANIQALWKSGRLVAAGPFGDEGELLGLFVLKIDSLEDAAAVLATDPAIAEGRLAVEPLRWWATPGIGREYRERAMADTTRRDSMVTWSFVLLDRGPAWTADLTPKVKRLLDDHLRNTEKLQRSGDIIAAGPFDGTGNRRGVFVFAADTARTRRMVFSDPAVRAGRFAPEIHTWWTAWGTIPGH